MQDHRHALAEQQRGDQVALHPRAQGEHLDVVGRSLDTEVLRPVVALAVVVVLAVGLVVLLVVGDEIAHREAVVRGHEVDAGERTAAGVLVEVGGAGDPARELAEGRLAAPEVAHRVAVLAVPLGPLGREVADLVAAGADVPGLRDQLDLADHRVLLHQLEERRQLVDVVELPGQRGGQVEPEAVDVHLGDPVAQRVHDQLQRVRVAGVERVPGAGVVHVVVLLVVDEPVVGSVVDALHAQRRAQVVALGGVVVDHVEDHLDAGGVHGLDHALELLDLLTGVVVGGVVRVRGEEAEGVVAPVVAQSLVQECGVLDELVHRHQLDGGHPELGEVVGHGRVRETGVGAALLLGHLGVELGQALDVRLVDHGLVVGHREPPVALPVEEGVHHDAERHVRGGVLVVAAVLVTEVVAEERLVPLDLAVRRLGVGVEQQLVGVAAQAPLGLVGPVHPVAVALPGLDLWQEAVPHVRVDLGELDARLVAVLVEQTQLDALGHLAEQREVGAAAVERRTERVSGSWPDVHCGLSSETRLQGTWGRPVERSKLPRG